MLKAVVGWNTEFGPICLKCSALNEVITVSPIIEGIGSGVYCFKCNLKVNRVAKILKYSLFAQFAKAEKKNPYPITEPDNFYDNLPKHPKNNLN